jgi:hypothetical protein
MGPGVGAIRPGFARICDESPLPGESDLCHRFSMAYKNTLVSNGKVRIMLSLAQRRRCRPFGLEQ